MLFFFLNQLKFGHLVTPCVSLRCTLPLKAHQITMLSFHDMMTHYRPDSDIQMVNLFYEGFLFNIEILTLIEV